MTPLDAVTGINPPVVAPPKSPEASRATAAVASPASESDKPVPPRATDGDAAAAVATAFARVPDGDAAEAFARELAHRHYENFSVVSLLLPPRLRQDFCNVYAFCRIADDLGDEVPDAPAALKYLNQFRDDLLE